MSTKVRNIHATENRRVQLIPKNGAVGNPTPESADDVVTGGDGSLSFCLTPAIMCTATENIFRALTSSGAVFDTAQGVALAAKYVVSPMGPGDVFSEHIVRESDVSFFNPNDIVERIIPSVQFQIENFGPEEDFWYCKNGDMEMGIHVYFQDPSGASASVGSNLQYPITINGTLHDLRFTGNLQSVHSYPTIEAFKEAIDAVYTTLGNQLKALGLGFDFELVGDGPWVNAVGLGSITTSRLLVKWSSKSVVAGDWGSPLITPGGTNSYKWWCTFAQSFDCKDGPADWKEIANDLGVSVVGFSSDTPMEEKDGWVLEIGTHEHFGLPLPAGCVDYFTLCGLTDSTLLVSCMGDAPPGPTPIEEF